MEICEADLDQIVDQYNPLCPPGHKGYTSLRFSDSRPYGPRIREITISIMRYIIENL